MRGIEPPTSAWKADMLASTPHPHYLELRGFEPLTPCLQGRCSSQLSYNPILLNDGPDEIRTHDFYLARVALSQLSYKPIFCRWWFMGYAPRYHKTCTSPIYIYKCILDYLKDNLRSSKKELPLYMTT